MLEPDAAKVACPVFRREWGGDTLDLTININRKNNMKPFTSIILILAFLLISMISLGLAENGNNDKLNQSNASSEKSPKLNKNSSLFSNFTTLSSEISALSTSMGHSPVFGLLSAVNSAKNNPDKFPILSKLSGSSSGIIPKVLIILAITLIFGSSSRIIQNISSYLEDKLAILVLIGIPLLAFVVPMKADATVQYQVIHAGFLGDFVINVEGFLFAAMGGLNFFIISTVRYSFGSLATLFSPIPGISVIFFLSRSGFAYLMMKLYSWSPYIATAINIIIIIIALLIFRWSYRLVRYTKEVLIEPIFRRILRLIFRKQMPYQLVSESLPKRNIKRASLETVGLTLCVPIFVLKCPKLKKRIKGYLLHWKDRKDTLFIIPRFLQKPIILQWPITGDDKIIGDALLHLEVQTLKEEKIQTKFAMTRGYFPLANEIAQQINFNYIGKIGVKGFIVKLAKKTSLLAGAAIYATIDKIKEVKPIKSS